MCPFTKSGGPTVEAVMLGRVSARRSRLPAAIITAATRALATDAIAVLPWQPRHSDGFSPPSLTPLYTQRMNREINVT